MIFLCVFLMNYLVFENTSLSNISSVRTLYKLVFQYWNPKTTAFRKPQTNHSIFKAAYLGFGPRINKCFAFGKYSHDGCQELPLTCSDISIRSHTFFMFHSKYLRNAVLKIVTKQSYQRQSRYTYMAISCNFN